MSNLPPWAEPLRIACWICNAKPGEPCGGQTMEQAEEGQGFHGGRIVASLRDRQEAIRESNRQEIMDDLFNERILRWLRKRHENDSFEVTSVESVRASGTDYAGSTEDGWHAEFCVDIWYHTTDPERPKKFWDVEGDDMQSLWEAVVGGQ